MQNIGHLKPRPPNFENAETRYNRTVETRTYEHSYKTNKRQLEMRSIETHNLELLNIERNRTEYNSENKMDITNSVF